jgi:monoamine oxidase
VTARAAIVTVPIGVLHAAPDAPGAIGFDPAPAAALGAARRLAMGQVRRIALLFRDAWWETRHRPLRPRAGDLARLTFLHGDDDDFPVWWTSYPSRVPLLVGWVGGRAAEAVANVAPEDVEARAVRAIARQLGAPPSRVRRELRRSWTHDWAADPYARGAYSYTLVGGSGAGEALARPVAGTLFFAGEATADAGQSGTVDGAIASGRRAAAQLRRALARPPRSRA